MTPARVLLAGIALATAASQAMAAPSPGGKYQAAIDAAKAVMMADPVKALATARIAEGAAVTLPASDRQLAAARARWLEGEALSRMDRVDDALSILQSALATVTRVAPADRLHGDLLLSRGWALETRGHIAAGLADFQAAFELYRAAGEQRGQAKALQNIAGIYQDAGDNDRAERYYTQSTEVYRGDPAFALAAHNNAGESLRLLGRYAAAEQQYALALKAARTDGSTLLQANVLTNLASTRLRRGDVVGAEKLAAEALRMSASGSAADERPFVWGVMAQIAIAKGEPGQAATLIGRTFAGVDLQHSSLNYLDFHKLAADIYARDGQPALALEHMRAWKRLDDGVRAVAASTNAALMAAKFDFSTQNLRIAQLQANRARLHETVLAVVAAAVALIASLSLAGVVSLRRSRNAIRAVNRDLTKALEAKSEFLAMTSHEIRTPLNGILGMTQVILTDRAITGPLRSKIELVNSAGETMRALVDDILDLSKMESGNLTVVPTMVRARELLADAADLWRAKAETKGLAFDVDLRDCPTSLEEDGDRLRQIVFNLLSNAVKFTDEGTIALRAAAVGDRLVLTVADTGIGIAPQHHEIIFEKFQQADASTSRRYGGTGLGLSICRNLVQAMGGEISVESAAGKGAVFTVDLPLRSVPEGEAAEPAGGVVLCEPNPLTQRILTKALGEEFGPVRSVADGEALLRAIEDTVPAVLIAPPSVLSEAVIARLGRSAAPPHLVMLLAADEQAGGVLTSGIPVTVVRRPFTAATIVAALQDRAAGDDQRAVA